VIQISTKLYLQSLIPVSVNHYIKPRGFIIWKGKTPIAQVSLYETAEAKKYKKEFSKYIQNQVKIQGWELIPNKTQHFYIDCIFYFDRIDKDANNYFKLLLDSITETQLIWLDDNVTCERVNGIYYDSKNPHIDITIYPVSYVGIFPTSEQLQQFKSNCISCSKYKNGKCSILNKAIEGRIQNEIQDFQCMKYKIKE
jgi:Holliday junction resolvase RusA-like endonuclease